MPSLGSYLQPVIDTGIQMKDYAHASRLYADNVFALAPKAGWLYYVVFDVEPSAITDQQWANQQRLSEVGMLVKAADLPKFTMQTEVVNQYNRKTVIQKGITYNPLNITMHDDQSNVVHNLWLNYYRYYYADSTWGGTGPIGTARDNTPGAYQNNKYLPANDLFNPTNYGMNSKLVVAPFFRSITIYQLNRKLFTSFKLVNPIIQAWEHDRVDQSQGNKLSESKMNINYEAVFYGVGQVKKDTPTGFAIFHYDTSPSPLSIAGGGNNSIFGPGGVIPGALDIFGDVGNILNPDSSVSPLGVLGTVLKGTNLVQNIKGVTAESLRSEGYAILNNTLRGVAQGSLNGLGVNLNLNKGNNYATTGQFLGTPVAVASLALADFGGGPIQTQTTGIPPSSANAADAAATQARNLQENAAYADNAQVTGSSNDNSTSGSSAAAGTYFIPAQPLSDTTPYTAPEIDTYSAPEDIQTSLKFLNEAQAGDLDYYNSQKMSDDAVVATVNGTQTKAELDAVKADVIRADAAEKALLQQITDKYSAERSRLENLLSSAKTRTSGTAGVQTEADASPSSPSPESSSSTSAT